MSDNVEQRFETYIYIYIYIYIYSNYIQSIIKLAIPKFESPADVCSRHLRHVTAARRCTNEVPQWYQGNAEIA